MRDLTQRSINNIITFSGVSLHSGKISTVILEPAKPNHGITINGLILSPLYIIKTVGMTTHGFIDQIEHIISALFSLQIDNIKILIDTEEAPVMDGANKSIIDEILKVGINRYTIHPRKIWYPKEEIKIESDDSYVHYIPHDDAFNISNQFICKVDFPYVGKQEYSWLDNDFDEYYNNISNAKTFFWDKQIEEEYKKGRCKGVIKNTNCLIFNKKDKLNNNELSRHKLLDFIGDIGVFNIIIPGTFIAYKAGHRLHIELIMKLWEKYATENSLIFEHNQMMIPYIKIPSNYDLDELMHKFKECIINKDFVNSKYVTELEMNLKKFIGCKHVLTTNSGTSALQLSIMALDLPKSSNILVPNLTFWATYEAVKLVGHKPIIIDVDNNFQMNFELIKRAIDKYDISAILIVHLYGFVHPQLDEIKKYCHDKNVFLLEDGSHTFGTKYNGNFVFKDSFLAGISLFPTKILGSCGNAGIIITNNDIIANKLKMYRDNGRDKLRYQHELIGTNNIMNSIQAIYTNNCLKKFPKTLYKMAIIFQVYKKKLEKLNTMKFIDVDNNICNGYMSILICRIHGMLYSKLKQFRNSGINVANIYPDTIINQPGFDKNDITLVDGTSDRICKSIINLPNYYDLTDIEQKYIIDKATLFDKIDIVIIGLGRMGMFHLKELQLNNKFNIIGFIDLFVDEFKGIKKFNNINEAKEAGAFVAIVSTPTKTHFDVVDECLDNDVHVLVEKPAFLDVESHTKIINKAKKRNLKVTVGMVERFNSSYSKIDEINKKDIVMIEAYRICRFSNDVDKSLLLFDLACHDIDLILLHFGKKFVRDTSYLKDNIYTINGKIDHIPVKLIIGYSNEIQKRNHIIHLKDKTQKNINLLSKDNLLKFEHEAFYNFLLEKESKICTLDGSLPVIKLLNQINNLT